ncbi:TIR domain-containing protein [Chryseobacterium sp. Tr-659]|uniref:TIR domain-containing protein n=1 Tax=Chryseobacterium sp. Tr-659 TaxID=2608340 RepID=UPI0014247A51|nr:TIR domain-containing protein [Chryseobacterium sp. Tr-659]NIF05148.1 TIR domain-containing protein [Chryseobacterium sp. Tr-659]
MNQINKILHFFIGYDFFISYSRSDCSEYAANLANIIIEDKYSCYLDQWGSLPGKELPNSLKRKIKYSSVLILLGSEASLTSKAIEEEIHIFLQTEKIIIPVALTDISKAQWFESIEGIALSDEKTNFLKMQFSTELLKRVKNSLNYTRQSIRIRNSIITFLLLILTSVGILFFLFSERKKLQIINVGLADSIQIKKESVKHIEIMIKKKEDSLKLLSSLFSDIKRTLKIKEDSLNKTESELHENQNKLLNTHAELDVSNKKVENFTVRTLMNYEPPTNIDCNYLSKEHVILFEPGMDRITPAYISYLNKLLICLKTYQNVDIIIKSYDFENDMASKAYILKLTQRRGNSIKNYLINQGFPSDHIKSIGSGNIDDGKKLLNLVKVSRTEIIISDSP